MKTILVLLFILGCIGIWYFTKKQPNKRNRNISIAIIILSGIFIAVYPTDSKTAKTNTEQPTESKTKDLKLDIAKDFTSDDHGKVTITGKTTPNAQVTIGMGIVGDKTTADNSGKFTLNYSLEEKKDDTLSINSSLDGKSTSTKVTVKLNDVALASLAEKEKQESESKEKEKQDQLKASQEKEQKSEESKANRQEQDKKASDITILANEATIEQQTILDDLAQQQFKEKFPYKGSKMHDAVGVIQPWTQLDGQWYKKVNATIANAYGAERDTNIEIHITPESPTSGTVEIINY